MKRIHWILIFLAAFLLRLHRIEQPPVDFHQVRQYIGATVSRAFYLESQASAPSWQRAVATYSRQHEGLLEPQVLPWLTAQAYRLVGGEHLWLPRAGIALCWLAAALLVLQLAGTLWGYSASVVAGLFMLFMPYGIMASRSFQPDPVMILGISGALACLPRYEVEPRLWRLAPILGITMAAMIIRPMAIFFVFPPYLLLQSSRLGWRRALIHPHCALVAVLPVLPAAAYYIHGILQGDLIRAHVPNSFQPRLWLEPAYWSGWLEMIGRTAGWLPALAGLLALATAPRSLGRTLLLGLWAGYLAYGLLFSYHIHTHDYYSLPLLPIVALSLAAGWPRVVERFASLPNRFPLRPAAVALVLVGVASGAAALIVARGPAPSSTAKMWLKSAGALVGLPKKFVLYLGREDALNADRLRDWVRIGELIGHATNVIVIDSDWGRAAMYHGRFWGTALTPFTDGASPTEPPEFDHLVKETGAGYCVVTAKDEVALQPRLAAHLGRRGELLEQGKTFQIYRLKP